MDDEILEGRRELDGYGARRRLGEQMENVRLQSIPIGRSNGNLFGTLARGIDDVGGVHAVLEVNGACLAGGTGWNE